MIFHTAWRRSALCLAFVLGLLMAGGLTLRAAATPPEPDTAQVSVAPGKLVIGVPPRLDEATLRRLAARHGATVERWLPRLGLALLRVPVGQERAAATALAAEDTVDFVGEHRRLAQIADIPGDWYFAQQWGMARIEAPAAWDLAWGHPSVPIAVIDTGANYLHADLESQLWYNPGESVVDPVTGRRSCNTPLAFNGQDDDNNGYVDDCRGYDFVIPDNNPWDEHGHGTFVAGIAAAATNNPDTSEPGRYEGVAGAGRNAQLMVLRTLNSGGTGYTLDIAEAIEYAAANGARVINLSLTFPPTTPGSSPDMQMLQRAVESAQAQGALLVAASGNENYPGIDYPAKFPGVLAVGASTFSDTRAGFSNYGTRLDLVAPGEGIFSTLARPGNRTYGYYGGDPGSSSGTSFATPHAAGVAALVRALRPDLSEAAVYDLLRQTVDDVGAAGFDNLTGWGRLDARAAVSEALVGLSLTVSPTTPGVGINGQTTVRVRMTDPAGGVAGLGARVALTAGLGTLTPVTVTLNERGEATAQFTAGPTPGAAHIGAVIGVLSATTTLSVTSGVPAALTLAAARTTVVTNGGAVITATVRDEGGNPVINSSTVTFTATLGSVNPASAMTAQGQAVTHFTAGDTAGTSLVQAQAGNFTATLPLTILGVGEPYTLTLAAGPASIAVDGAPASITATVLDAFGGPVSDGILVRFTTDLGTLSAPEALTANGQARVTLTAGAKAGSAHVGAEAGSAQGTLTVPILAGPAAEVTLTAAPAELNAGYNQIARLHATAADRHGNPVTDGTRLAFATTLGQLAATSVPTVDGSAEVNLVGGLVAGQAVITVSAPGGAQSQTPVTIRPGAPATLDLAATPGEITVGGQVSRLAATVRDTYGNLVADGAVVTFTVNLGGLRPITNGGAAPALTLAGQTVKGVAQVDFISGEVAGTAEARAAAAQTMPDSVIVTIRPGPASALTLSVEPPTVRGRGRVELSAWVTDRFGNPVANGAPVSFLADAGTLSQTVVPTQDGAAITYLTAPPLPGTVQVAAACGSASKFATVTVEEGPPWQNVYLPLIRRP